MPLPAADGAGRGRRADRRGHRRRLRLPGGTSAHQAWNAIDLQIRASADATADIRASIADRIWPRPDVPPDQTWIDLLASEHGTDVHALDLTADPEGSRSTVNN